MDEQLARSHIPLVIGVQFVALEHTEKSMMIRAARAGRIGDTAIVDEYVRLGDYLVRPT